MFSQLTKLYPEMLIDPIDSEINLDEYKLFSYNNHNIYIPTDQLTEKEDALLELILSESLDEEDTSIPKTVSPWSRFLLGHTMEIPDSAEYIRILHLDFYVMPDQFAFDIWLETISEAFLSLITVIPHTERRLSLVLEVEESDAEFIENLSGVLQTLDSDFDLSTQGLIGQIYAVNNQLPELFQLEFDLFEQALSHDYIQLLSTLPIVLLRMMGRNFYREQPLLKRVQQIIVNHPDYISTITKLFENQGNLSQTADQLFIHRNTLTYRMNKFYKETGYNLQHLPDLILCYLAI